MLRVDACGRMLLAVAALAAIGTDAATQDPAPSGGAGTEIAVPTLRIARIKTTGELRLEGAIRDAFLACFRRYEIDGKSYDLRIPFGENGERTDDRGFSQNFYGSGKAGAESLWRRIDALLMSSDFLAYREALREEGPKEVVFDLESAGWTVRRGPQSSARGEPDGGEPDGSSRTEIHVFKADSEITAADIYDYLYSVGSVGMDCSGFVSYIQRAILGHNPGFSSLWYFTPASGFSETVGDRIIDLRPGDIFIFFGHEGTFRHSAVIQSIDWDEGVIRYLQDTDWAPRDQRGVHESTILFDTRRPQSRLGDPSVRWNQVILPAFPGEPGLKYWRTDGDRFRTVWPRGRSLVVRLISVKEALGALEPDFYVNRIKIGY